MRETVARRCGASGAMRCDLESSIALEKLAENIRQKSTQIQLLSIAHAYHKICSMSASFDVVVLVGSETVLQGRMNT